jgi:uncharacterized cupin superfamily protein
VLDEAPLVESVEGGLVPDGDGWFVVNAREARWLHTVAFGSGTVFEGETPFPTLGINVNTLRPGQPLCMYHAENAQEDFLVLAGECLLLVEEEERPLRAWDFVHCPAGTKHVIVGAGDSPSVVLAVGYRPPEWHGLYPVSEVAQRHGAGVEQETTTGREAYARFPPPERGPYRDGDLPDL